ncbi:glycoside hydrolase [Paraphoma chrysanthemicola]|uniref:AA9 family lytic polysaccharide monooxygenase n=1 Tax=Paraphoma chrysanthemicola TaxID=798071 RepID=A0A8K0R1W9_9PLEO|nr:glycoside hydrolase [Paraphoma chrysanthemicola]
MLSIAFVLGVSVFSSLASAHGNVRKWLMNGKEYITYLPYDQPDLTQPPVGIARFLGNGINPMKDPLSPAMTCNVNSYPAPLMANVTAGSTITATWNSWPHVGPIYTYMSPCPNGHDCSDFLGTTEATWFKIEEAGVVPYKFASSGLDWATQIMFDAKNKWNIVIPKCLPDGPYLIRHETMAIHDSNVRGGAQFYPNCAQVWVSGGSSTLDLKKAGVKLPGDIQPDDEGVLFDPRKPLTEYTYTVPGSRPIVC